MLELIPVIYYINSRCRTHSIHIVPHIRGTCCYYF